MSIYLKLGSYKQLKNTHHYLPHGSAPQHNWKGSLIDKSERYGAALAFGVAKGYYGPKFIWKGLPADAWIGATLTLISSAMKAMTNGRSEVALHVERVGDAGVMSAFNSFGAAWGMQKAGRSVAVLAPGKHFVVGSGQQVIGAIGPAPAGPYLSDAEIAHFAGPR